MFVEPMGKVERLYFMLQRLATPRPLDDVGRRIWEVSALVILAVARIWVWSTCCRVS